MNTYHIIGKRFLNSTIVETRVVNITMIHVTTSQYNNETTVRI